MNNKKIKNQKVGDSKSEFHESAEKHVSGSAQYVDDIPLPGRSLHAYLGFSECAHGLITSLDLEEVRAVRGVVDVFTANSIPGTNDISPTGKNDEPILAQNEVLFWGQPIFVVVAQTRLIARKAARLAKISYEELDVILDICGAEEKGKVLVAPSLELKNGNVRQALLESPRRIKGEIKIGGQDHFYLEGQVALSIPRFILPHSTRLKCSTWFLKPWEFLITRLLLKFDEWVEVLVEKKRSQINLLYFQP